MAEVLPQLPEELKAQVFSFRRHPVAELFTKRQEEGDKCLREHLKALQELFLHLTEQDMKLRKESDKYSCMCMLWVLLCHDAHQEALRWVARQLMDNTSMEPNAFLVLELLRLFAKQHKKDLFKRTPEKALEWCKKNAFFSDGPPQE